MQNSASKNLKRKEAVVQQQAPNKTKIMGIQQRKSGRWSAEIRNPEKKWKEWLGTFDTAEAAAHAYNSKKLEFKELKKKKHAVISASPVQNSIGDLNHEKNGTVDEVGNSSQVLGLEESDELLELLLTGEDMILDMQFDSVFTSEGEQFYGYSGDNEVSRLGDDESIPLDFENTLDFGDNEVFGLGVDEPSLPLDFDDTIDFSELSSWLADQEKKQ